MANWLRLDSQQLALSLPAINRHANILILNTLGRIATLNAVTCLIEQIAEEMRLFREL